MSESTNDKSVAKIEEMFEYASRESTPRAAHHAPHFHRKNLSANMFEAFFDSESFKKIAGDFPRGTCDYAATKGLFKRLIFELEFFLEWTNMRISWEAPAGKTNEVAALVIYDCEDDVVVIVPVEIGRSIITIDHDIIFMSWERSVTLLAKTIIDLISKMQAGAA